MSDTLSGSRSPFLKHGAEQPVRWMPWGAAAFERARRENKPILLDIGAVWCHWCHVMDRESYEDEHTAQLINELFVPIKVDRDERPDVDSRYQRAIQTLTGQGGWPLTAFLTPEGDTYYGGTYFPPADGYGRPSFKRVLVEVARLWREDPQRVSDSVRGINDRLASYAQAEAQPGQISRALLNETIEELAQLFDFRYGGFGRAPKFPNAGALLLLLDHELEQRVEWSGRIVRETLTAMARGGIYDQIGGGFHRYSVDARWLIPHFEKMAYDNGPLLEVYARAFATEKDPEYKRVVDGIIDYYNDVSAALLSRGGFPASQDADYSPDDDGDYWTWTADEIRAALNDPIQSDLALDVLGVNDPASAMHLDPNRHVLFRSGGTVDEATLSAIATTLKAVRDQRRRPFVDETVYTGWTALVTSGFLAAARHAGRSDAGEHALRALERMWNEAFDPARGFAHRLGDRDAGEYLEDQAHVLQAMIDAFEYSQDRKWLDRARAALKTTRARFFDAQKRAYRDRPTEADAPARSLTEPSFSIADSPVPAGNAVLALSLLRLSDLLADDSLRAAAAEILEAFAGAAPRLGTAAATYVRAVDWFTGDATKVVIVDAADPEESKLLRTTLSVYRPRTTVRHVDPAGLKPEELPPEVRAMLTGEAPRAYVCVGRTCFAPIADASELGARLTARA